MTQPKKLIEVAMPIKEISAASVHDKYVHHGHISTLHIWWARRPLPVCRAVVFASLVPDPLDSKCPQSFKDAVELLLGKENNIGDPYAPYADIPWTSIYDPMEDNLLNRLQMFVGKFTEPMQQHLLGKGPMPAAGKMLSNDSLITWESRTNEKIINKARTLIWVAHNAKENDKISAKELIADFDTHYKAIKDAELELYALENRHLKTDLVSSLEEKLESAKEAFLNKMPKVFDPFAGGGAIPLEAARLGCRSYGNDINPVAHIIQKGSLEFPQKFGKPITYSKEAFIKIYGNEELLNWCQQNGLHIDAPNLKIDIPNRLSFDVELYAKKMLNDAEKEIGHLYPSDKTGNKPLVYYWARIGICTNPSCKAEVPLLRQFYLSNKNSKQVFLKPIINGNKIDFEIKNGVSNEKSWIERANLKCPCCGSITDAKKLKEQFLNKHTSERLITVVEEGVNGKSYRLPNQNELSLIIPDYLDIPNEKLPMNDSQNLKITFWGFPKFGDMFSKRQLFAIQKLCDKLGLIKESKLQEFSEYDRALVTYLSIWIDRIASYMTSFGRWIPQNEQLTSVFGKQAIPMVFDYPEVSLFSPTTSGPLNQLEWILMYLNSENKHPFTSECFNASSGDKEQFDLKSLTAVVTDPPYYDAIAYADLSDFFYVWLKRTVADLYPLNFATPQTPKSDECTMLKHHHQGKKEKAKQHFEDKLTEIFLAIEHQTSDIVSIMFAHQSTEAWTTLCNSILGANMNITGSWAIDSERDTRMIANAGAALQSSVTVSCVPTQSEGYGDYKEVRKAIETTVAREVDELYKLGFRGADLLTACFGQAVSEFGKYKKVEKADGSEVTVAELLEMARESAFNALLKGFDGDEFTKFYIGWLQLNGFSESDFDDAAKFVKVGLSINVQELFTEHILIKNGNKQTLGDYAERIKANKNIGDKPGSHLIDQVHKAMHLYKGTNRGLLLKFISEKADTPDGAFWRVVTSLDELLPKDCEDQKLTRGLLSNKENLIRESKETTNKSFTQGTLEL
jgi:putative DNA methylase